ncbi:gamma-glutamyl-gamma-aminobutyrate hydrolase family protein [Candidatus Manganitrophus noduliformans]|uniref:Gamma-glutamyl-gamma-aminobutyrate hydrolase family protein n=1 Tax=Candidatus Manganitrophus noduliformans TaxID=2606439 RepID=A0A7X6DMD8_9BACT|nr:gamma-glutamyl-gamma-aminobutyrate hydrolase family protein [Candidatus Manganitrophus noduliformans]NKE69772.1 gamma-glutamyl-gamma-aminobutyrate hydrolase family protein [Candidatus Manganitrophus noduliformans]
MRPIIGITSDYNDGDRPEFGGKIPTCFLRDRYVHAIEATGGIPMILPPLASPSNSARSILERIDGLLLTGSGPDIDPEIYGEFRRFPFKTVHPKRFLLERELVRQAKKKGMPILGICGGMQLMNVAAGGSLYQDIKGQIPKAMQHQRGGKPAHLIEVKQGTLLSKILKGDRLRVNSAHHQGVKQVAPGYVVNAEADDGVIEGIEAVGYPFVLGVQWHPEFLNPDDQSTTLFKAFLKMAARHGKNSIR